MKFHKRLAAAFSLPEVAIATAIAAVSLVTIVGLLPKGLQSVQRSAQLTAEARIIRYMVGYLQLSTWGANNNSTNSNPWSSLSQLMGTARQYYFDSEGNQLTLGSSSAATDMAYVVQVATPGSQGSAYASPSQNVLPVLPGASKPSAQSIVVMIEVAPTSNPNFDFGGAPASSYTMQSVLLTRQFYSATGQ